LGRSVTGGVYHFLYDEQGKYMMLTTDMLLEAGYKKHIEEPNKTLYQKLVWSSDGSSKTYFINVYNYEYEKFTGWELDMAFDRDSKTSPCCWVKYQLDANNTTATDIERLAKDIFISNNGLPYGN
jgi:hypothetical protein